MESEQYEIMALAEERHWWYLGLRDAIEQCLLHPSVSLPPNPRILDAGCGTGANLRFLGDLLKTDRLVGFDLSEKALEYARMKVPAAMLYQSDLRDPWIPSEPFDLVLSSDVLYVTGRESAMAGLRSLCQSLKDGGIFLWNLPAYNWMMSYHDRLVHTQERFTRSGLASLCCHLGLKCLRLSYRLHFIFPLLLVNRVFRSLFCRSRASSDLRQPSPFVNRLLFDVLHIENRLIAKGLSFPWGSSVFAVCAK